MKDTVNRQRPINLDLATLKFPPMAIASILHRISGVLIFLGLPFLLYLLNLSLESASSFETLRQQLSWPYLKFALWVMCSALAFHIFMGIRHLIMDLGLGEEVHVARRSAEISMILAALMVLFLGIWLW